MKPGKGVARQMEKEWRKQAFQDSTYIGIKYTASVTMVTDASTIELRAVIHSWFICQRASSRIEAHRKFGENERCVRVA